MAKLDATTNTDELDLLRRFARRRRVSVFVNGAAIRKGLPYIELKARCITLATFHDPQDARKWLQPGGLE